MGQLASSTHGCWHRYRQIAAACARPCLTPPPRPAAACALAAGPPGALSSSDDDEAHDDTIELDIKVAGMSSGGCRYGARCA